MTVASFSPRCLCDPDCRKCSGSSSLEGRRKGDLRAFQNTNGKNRQDADGSGRRRRSIVHARAASQGQTRRHLDIRILASTPQSPTPRPVQKWADPALYSFSRKFVWNSRREAAYPSIQTDHTPNTRRRSGAPSIRILVNAAPTVT